jgi:hypothetical protein
MQIEQQNMRLQQAVTDSRMTLPLRYRERTLLSSVNIFHRYEAIGVGFFLHSPRRIVTVLHSLEKHYGNLVIGTTIVNGFMHRRQLNGEFPLESARFILLRANKKFDLAVLELLSRHEDAEYALELPDVGRAYETDKLAVTSFSNTLHEQAPVEIARAFCVIEATFIKSSEHHIVYHSNLFSGDSGGAVLFSQDGIVRAIHQETVNQAREELDRNSFNDDEIVVSVNSLISCLSQGFIGLRLDVEDVQQFIR